MEIDYLDIEVRKKLLVSLQKKLELCKKAGDIDIGIFNPDSEDMPDDKKRDLFIQSRKIAEAFVTIAKVCNDHDLAFEIGNVQYDSEEEVVPSLMAIDPATGAVVFIGSSAAHIQEKNDASH